MYNHSIRVLEERYTNLANEIDLAERLVKNADAVNRPNHLKTLADLKAEHEEIKEVIMALRLAEGINKPFKPRANVRRPYEETN